MLRLSQLAFLHVNNNSPAVGGPSREVPVPGDRLHSPPGVNAVATAPLAWTGANLGKLCVCPGLVEKIPAVDTVTTAAAPPRSLLT